MDYFIVLILCIYVVFGLECPYENINPCTCDREGINCRKIKNDLEFNSVFKKFPSVEARNIWIQGTRITKLTKDVFLKVKVQNFYLDMNFIRKIESGTFNNSMDVIDTISLYANEIESFPFEDVQKLKKLRILNLGQNRLKYLPDRCFYNHKSLKKIILIDNNLISIGQESFFNLPSLYLLDLSGNELTSLEDRSFASNINDPYLEINLSFNEISFISSTAFQGLKPHIINLDFNYLKVLEKDVFIPLFEHLSSRKGSFISFKKNLFSCTGCSYLWIVKLKDILETVVENFRCQDGRSLHELTRINIHC